MVIDTDSTPILSLSTCVQLNLINKISSLDTKVDVENLNKEEASKFVEKNKDVFMGLGKLPYEYKIKLKKDAIPVVNPTRRVPEIIKTKLKNTLDELEKADIIKKSMNQPTGFMILS